MESEKLILTLPDSSITYYPNFMRLEEANTYFSLLLAHTKWRQDEIKVFGKTYDQPRLTALYADNNIPYTYSHLEMHPLKFTKPLLEIKKKIESKTGMKISSCLLNLYRNGKDSNGWHADNEKELGPNPVIASISLGQKRNFHLRHRKKNLKHKMALAHGSLLMMEGATQHHWQHQVPKSAKILKERINLTYRRINKKTG